MQNLGYSLPKKENALARFPDMLRTWRKTRHLSQLALATEAEVSSRHISFLETGRAHPSREMVMKLASVLDIPRDARNDLLIAGGFAPAYAPLALDQAEVAAIREAVERTIFNHDPYPALVTDRLWRIQMFNKGARMMMAASGLTVGDSLLDFMVDPKGARVHIANWGEFGHHTIYRLRSDSRLGGGVPELDAAAEALAADPVIKAWKPMGQIPPVVPAVYQMGDPKMTMFSTFTPIGGADERSLADLKIEMMFPADDESAQMFKAMADGSPDRMPPGS